MAFFLGDDGTMDTVIVCGECGEEIRYNYASSADDFDADDRRSDQQRYDDFVDECIADAEDSHECEDTPCE